jgi:hypothetical protein
MWLEVVSMLAQWLLTVLLTTFVLAAILLAYYVGQRDIKSKRPHRPHQVPDRGHRKAA